MLTTIVLMGQHKANEEEQRIPTDIHLISPQLTSKSINHIAISPIK